jgi:hypothetical protein
LISAGAGNQDSDFVDASENGDDVFFTTGVSLLPQDPELIDIYDARVGGGFPPPQAPPAPCQGEGCQPPPSAPADDPLPASATFVGPEGSTGRARCPKGKHRVTKKGKSRCVKGHKKKGKKKKAGKAGPRGARR